MKKIFVNHTNHPSERWSSEQTAASRVYGQIADVQSLLEQVQIEKTAPKGRRRKSPKLHHVKVQKDDASKLSDSVKEAFRPLAQQYYLEEDVDPVVRISRDKLTVTIPLIDTDR